MDNNHIQDNKQLHKMLIQVFHKVFQDNNNQLHQNHYLKLLHQHKY